MAKVVFSFDDKSAKKLKNKKNILGGKGANLGEMGRLGLPVPPGFTITTDVCDIFYSNKKKLPSKILSQIKNEIIKIDKNIDNKPQISANLFNMNIFNEVGNNCIFKKSWI